MIALYSSLGRIWEGEEGDGIMQTQVLLYRIINHLLKAEGCELKSTLWLPALGGVSLKNSPGERESPIMNILKGRV